MRELSRRRLLALGIGAAVFHVQPALALSVASAKALVDTVVDEINRIINSGKSEAAMIQDFEAVFANYADVARISRYTLGPEARSMSDRDLARYSKAFQGYMARKYGKRFREFIGGYVKVRGAKEVKRHVEVQTVARLSGRAPFEVSFHVWDEGGTPKFFNMYIEGVNLLLSERTEILAMLDKRGGNVDRLIRDLQKVG